MTTNTITEQLTAAGRAIEHDSFSIIDAEAGPHNYTAEQWPVVRRMIHANADFDFNGLTKFHPEAMRAGLAAILKGGTPVVADTEMICVGLSKPRLAHFGMSTLHTISDTDVIEKAHAEGTTRAVQAMRKAHRLGKLEGAIVAIGNAPTALFHLLELILDGGPRPAAIVGCPVGFIGAAESKQALIDLAADHGIDIPYVTVTGRRGGSAMTSSALNALAQEEE